MNQISNVHHTHIYTIFYFRLHHKNQMKICYKRISGWLIQFKLIGSTWPRDVLKKKHKGKELSLTYPDMTTFLEWCARKQVLGTRRFASKHLGSTHEKVRPGKRKFKRCGACSQKVHVVAGKAEKTTNHKANEILTGWKRKWLSLIVCTCRSS